MNVKTPDEVSKVPVDRVEHRTLTQRLASCIGIDVELVRKERR